MGKSLTSDVLGIQNQTLRSLQERGWETPDYKAIGTDGAFADALTQVMLKFRLFATPAEMIQLLLEINETVWKDLSVTEQAIRALGDPPDCPVSDENGLYCVNIFRETGDAVKTFSDNWDACVDVHGTDGTWKWNGLLFTKDGVQQRDKAILRPRGLRWQVAELGRQFQKQCVQDVRPQLDKSKIMGMGQELPFIVAVHNRWAVSMDGSAIPFVDAPDLEVAPSASGGFSHAPCIIFNRDSRQVCLNAYLIGYADPYFGSGSLR